MSKTNVFLLITALSISLPSFAQTAKKSAKKSKAKEATAVEKFEPSEAETSSSQTRPAVPTDEADQVITNRRLRASSGSLSKWSGNISANYQAGSVEKPFAAQRPNITAGADALTLQYMSANVGLRYTFSTLNSLTLATGMFMSTPFNTNIKTDDPELEDEFKKTKGVLTVSDPNLIYTNLARVWGFQVVTQLTPTLITNSQQRHQGYRWMWDVTSTWMRDIGSSGLSAGAAFEWTGYSHDKPNDKLASNVWQLYPVAEYVINETFNLRTLWGWQVHQQTRDDHWVKRKVYQSFGVGISLSRDVFIYPNIQFIPSDMRADRTNLGISAYINTF